MLLSILCMEDKSGGGITASIFYVRWHFLDDMVDDAVLSLHIVLMMFS